MGPKIIDGGQIILVGFNFFGDPFKLSGGWTEENEIGRLWQRFMAYFAQQRQRIKHIASASTDVASSSYRPGSQANTVSLPLAHCVTPGSDVPVRPAIPPGSRARLPAVITRCPPPST